MSFIFMKAYFFYKKKVCFKTLILYYASCASNGAVKLGCFVSFWMADFVFF